ncbi:hypothetical protein [Actibacterium sp. 188UL27-1]|uniref:hypothetical protein n=1 Tax=Actibacterium sp. 188UL27-1 TaxID=2786961 RepID=UPI00195C177D|nr:hypothetical protein [Actibacterium sp. 188UL27-1]MBM7069815.1 hypothetical protein [Actibacterium sp. 188UL27-1]
MGEDPDPLKIYQHNLDVVSEAILSGNFDGISQHIRLPHICRMGQTDIVIEREEDYVQGMREYGEGLRNQGVTNYIRLGKAARFMSDRFISGWHMTYVLSGATSIVRPYRSRMVLQLEDACWRVVQSDHELAADRWPVIGQSVVQGAVSGDYENSELDFRVTSESADPIYQAFLDALSAANNTNDFKAWCGLSSYPQSVHIKTVDHIILQDEDNRPFFEMVRTMLDRYADGRIDRKVKKAHFLTADKIVGYHICTFYDGDQPVMSPVESRMIVHHVYGGWKLASVTNAVSNATFPYEEPEVTQGLMTICEIQERMRQ